MGQGWGRGGTSSSSGTTGEGGGEVPLGRVGVEVCLGLGRGERCMLGPVGVKVHFRAR